MLECSKFGLLSFWSFIAFSTTSIAKKNSRLNEMQNEKRPSGGVDGELSTGDGAAVDVDSVDLERNELSDSVGLCEVGSGGSKKILRTG